MKNKKLPIIIGIVLGLLVIIGVVLFIVLRQNKITITFINDDRVSSTIKVKKGEKITLPNTSKDGYTFEGWYYENEKLRDGVWFDHDVTIRARWIEALKPTMTIVFDTDGGEKLESQTIECDTPLNLPTPTKEGYKFINWLDKNEIIISNETKLACEDVELKAKWEQVEKKTENKPTETKPAEVKKEYTCPDGYTLDGTKCKITKEPSYACPNGTKADGELCIRTSDNNAGTRVCKSDTVTIDGKGHTWTGQGEYYLVGNSYGKCAYYNWTNITNQSDCVQTINRKAVWVSELNGCYAETKMNNYETVCASDYQYYSSGDLSSKFGIHDNGKCLRKVSKEAHCESGYTLTNNKCIKTIDATEK